MNLQFFQKYFFLYTEQLNQKFTQAGWGKLVKDLSTFLINLLMRVR